MMSDQNADLNTIRTQLNGVIERAKSDPAFLAQLKSDTVGTLQAAGIPHGAAGELSDQMGFDGGEVSGYMKAECGYTCDRYSCIATWCGYMPLTN
jgi:hypothetical protein